MNLISALLIENSNKKQEVYFNPHGIAGKARFSALRYENRHKNQEIYFNGYWVAGKAARFGCKEDL